MRKIRSAAVVAALLGLAGAGFTVPAQAGTAAYAPACVARHSSWAPLYVKITNNCGKTMRLTVNIANSSDWPCETYAPGQVRSRSYSNPLAEYRSTSTC